MIGERRNTERLNESNNEEAVRIRRLLGDLGLEGQVEIAMPFRAKEQSPQTGEWVARINPKTGKQVEVPALIPIDRLDVCPVPLEEFDDQKLKDWIWAANEYRVAKIPPESEPMARKAGGFLLQQAEQMRASAG